ncbi:MAG TPA: PHB depolymerase family esterase [Planctomycetota bacterium]|nr:PHB depolymerase family esterase [Planctomycetota bacterium]
MSPLPRALLLIAVVLTPCLALESGTVRRTLVSSGVTRTYDLHVPRIASATRPLPLVIAFHAFTSSSDATESGSGFSPLADQEGFIVAYPNALPHPEIGGNSWLSRAGATIDGNDVLIGDLVADIRARHAVDPRRIFASGMSQGGAMSYLAAGAHPELFAAIAPVVVSLPRSFALDELLPPRPVPVLIINGTDDRVVPYHGGLGIFDVDFMPTEALAKRLAAHDACFPYPFIYDLPNWNWFDGCAVRVTNWFWGAQDSEVVLYTITGGGHTWPGSRTWMPWFILGNTCHDIDATRVIWDFFKRHPMPGGLAN